MIDGWAADEPFVMFVGAGASAVGASRLPTWTEFNDLLLECLCESIDDFSENRQPTDSMLQSFRDKRDKASYLSPDFQAQLMEDEIGPDYFRVWQSLESKAFGPVHRGFVRLAQEGKLAAIITTNFDRLIEMAFERSGLHYRVYYDAAGFESFSHDEARQTTLPIIKIHGSIEDTSSLVDTLRQRVIGTSPALIGIIKRLLHERRWLFLGFSGADLDYNPYYLGLLDAAPDAKGFCFLAREGSILHKGVSVLVEAYGRDKAEIVYGDLTTWLHQTFTLSLYENETDQSQVVASMGSLVKEKIKVWTQGIGVMAVVNIVYAILRSSDLRVEALWLMRKTWRSYRVDSEPTRAYARYNYNYGISLSEAGLIQNDVRREEDGSNFSEWKEAADENAYEFLGRCYSISEYPPAAANLAAILALRGELRRALDWLSLVEEDMEGKGDSLMACDCAVAAIQVFDVLRSFERGSALLYRHVEMAQRLGDEPRRAILSVHLGRFLTYEGRFEEAKLQLDAATVIAERLGLHSVLMAAKAATGRWFSDGGTSDERAIAVLSEVADHLGKQNGTPLFYKQNLLTEEAPRPIYGIRPETCRVLLDLNRAARFAAKADIVNQTLDKLDKVAVLSFPGYTPHYYFAYVESLLWGGDLSSRKLISELIERALSLEASMFNPWVVQTAQWLDQEATNKFGPCC